MVRSGKIVLITLQMSPGVHEIHFAAAGKNALSAGYTFGFDALELEEQ